MPSEPKTPWAAPAGHYVTNSMTDPHLHAERNRREHNTTLTHKPIYKSMYEARGIKVLVQKSIWLIHSNRSLLMTNSFNNNSVIDIKYQRLTNN